MKWKELRLNESVFLQTHIADIDTAWILSMIMELSLVAVKNHSRLWSAALRDLRTAAKGKWYAQAEVLFWAPS